MIRQNKERKLPVIFENIGRWWGNNPVERRKEEVDFIAIAGNTAIFGECKWKNNTGVDVLNELRRKAGFFKQFKEKYYYIFAKGQFSDSLNDIAVNDKNVRLVSLNDIYA